MDKKTLDIVNLIDKNPLIKLSGNYQHTLLNKIKETFTEDQQQLFVGSFYSFLNYDVKNDFIITLDNVWKWCGFSRKDPAKVVIIKNFKLDVDYKVIKAAPEVAGAGGSGLNKETILMTINTFKKFCLKAGTKKADEIHDYYIKLEELLQQTLEEEANELRNQLITKNKQLALKDELITKLENKPETEGFIKKTGYIYLIKENDKAGHYKIGYSTEPLKRLISLNSGSSTNSLEIVRTFPTKDCIAAEKIAHCALTPHKIKNQKEWFYFPSDDLLPFVIHTLEKCINIASEFNYENTKQEKDFYNKIIKPPLLKYVSIETQTEIITEEPNDFTLFDDNEFFKKFINDCCIINKNSHVNIKYIVQQYKLWSKIQNVNNYKEFDTYIRTKFNEKQIYSNELNNNVLCLEGINLKPEYTQFNFKEPLCEFEKFLIDCCVKRPTARINKTDLKKSYLEWKQKINPELRILSKLQENQMYAYVNKHFFHDLFYDGKTSYMGWYGFTIKEKGLIGSGALISNSKKIKVAKYSGDTEIKRWDSQAIAANELGISPSTLKSWIKNKSIKNNCIFKIINDNI